MFSRFFTEATAMISAIWIGLILGVSFFAAPIKFTAVGVGREQLLAVGQVTFQAFSWVEIFVFGLLVCMSIMRLTRGVALCLFVLALLLLVQKLGILPGLDTQLDRTVAGETVEKTNLHMLYVVTECIKLVFLFIFSLALRSKRGAP